MKVRTREEIKKEFTDALEGKYNTHSVLVETLIDVHVQNLLTLQDMFLEDLKVR